MQLQRNNEAKHILLDTLRLLASIVVLLGGTMGSSIVLANTPAVGGESLPGSTEAEKSDSLKLQEILGQPFVYQRENRPDPFVPFVSEEKTPEQIEVEEEILTGMQLFEPGQLQLVTILFSGNKAVAMVQDSTGRGHILKEGQKIGRRGEVKDIMPNVVKIEEWYLTTAGKRRYKTIDMVLRKEGEK